VLYGYNNETTEFGLRRLVVDEAGVREEKVWEGAVAGFGTDVTFAGGRVYSSRGSVWDVASETVVGTNQGGRSVVVDVALKRAYYLSDAARIEAFDTEKMVRKESFTVPKVKDVQGGLVRLGGTALVFRTRDQIVVVPLKSLR
jgi:hypothetical protein